MISQKHGTRKSHRGLSAIIGNLVILAMVASIGSIILFNGLNEISAFNFDLTAHDQVKNESLREDLVFEHVRFDPNTNNITIYLNNIGTVESTISSLSITKLDTQETVTNWHDLNTEINIQDTASIPIQATLTQGNGHWNQTYYNTSPYKISITTLRGNFFSTVVSAFNN